jgi:electron transfer flavoprotein beta subunit
MDLKILVCIKQVADAEGPLEVDPGRSWIRDSGKTVYRLNRYDENALEEAHRIKESFPGVTVDAVSVGPARVLASLKKALELGADSAAHIAVDEEQSSPFTVSSLIAGYARSRKYDLILAGVMAEDDMQCMVGPLVAAMLGIPCATAVMKIEIVAGNAVEVECELDGGRREKARLTMPCLVAVQTGINRPRYPTLTNVLRARSQEVVAVHPAGLEPMAQRERAAGMVLPEAGTKGELIGGTIEEKAEKLIEILHGKSLI